MSRNTLKRLRMMGYETRIDPLNEIIEVSLTTESGRYVRVLITFHKLREEYVIERIVKAINERLKADKYFEGRRSKYGDL